MTSFIRHCAIMAGTGVLAFALGTATASAAYAANPAGTGQPSQECGEEDASSTPGHTADAPGAPFNEDGVAGQHYAGEQPQNSNNPKSVSQYDVACLKVTQNT